MWTSIVIFQTRVAPVRVFSIVSFLACIAAVGMAIKALVELKAERRWSALAMAITVMVVSGIGVYMAYIVTILTLARGAGTP